MIRSRNEGHPEGRGPAGVLLLLLLLALYPAVLACGKDPLSGIQAPATAAPRAGLAPTDEPSPIQSASSELEKFQLSWVVEPSGAGSVAVKPAALGFQYARGATVQVRAIPKERFRNWGGDLTGSENPASFVMDGDKTIVALFEPLEPDRETVAVSPAAVSVPTLIPPPTQTPRPAPTPMPTASTAPVATPTPEVAVTGLVRGGTISGRVTDAGTGLPMRNVYVRDEEVDTGSSHDLNTKADGTFEITGLPAGVYRIEAEAQETGYVREYYDDTVVYDDARLVPVAVSESVAGIDFDLTTGASISGKVVDAQSGSPVRDTQIRAEPDFGGGEVYAGTDDAGRYTLAGLAPGSYLILAENYDLGYIGEYYEGKLSREEANRSPSARLMLSRA